jgi:D-tagatose-bisphosphate aldolase class II non-catalytic subunit
MTALDQLQHIIAENRAGKSSGITSWCTAHPDTLRAILRAHHNVEGPILIEATCNQVNHQGGYTGMTPQMFRQFVEQLASDAGIDAARIILGGDHLGPNPWKHIPAAEALVEARHMVRAYVDAGFTKIHLDASMACVDDSNLHEQEMATRAATLCAVAESVKHQPVNYVIGTEVPIPGGETEQLETLAVTSPEAVRRTYALHEAAFKKAGLADAFSRAIALVVQPGVDFGNSQVFAFDPEKAARLTGMVETLPQMVFEAHSTDYQTPESLAGLLHGHFAIMKVGPELTFAYREAVFAMAAIEDHLAVDQRSAMISVVNDVMNSNDRHWRAYIPKGSDEPVLKLFGLSDRVRYYWPDSKIAAAVSRLQANINHHQVPSGLVMQYAGALEPGTDPLSTRIINHKLGAVVRKYLTACGQSVLQKEIKNE